MWYKYQECNEVPTPKCEEKEVKVPKQEKEHKKKCLLADDNALPATSAPAPEAYPTPAPTTYADEPANTNVIRLNSTITFIQTFGNGQFSTLDYDIPSS